MGEVLLWLKIKGKQLGVRFYRQVPIDTYIVDFFCPERLLVIEVDGSSHTHGAVWAKDVSRQHALEKKNIRFLRFQESQIRSDLAGVVMTIKHWLESNP